MSSAETSMTSNRSTTSFLKSIDVLMRDLELGNHNVVDSKNESQYNRNKLGSKRSSKSSYKRSWSSWSSMLSQFKVSWTSKKARQKMSTSSCSASKSKKETQTTASSKRIATCRPWSVTGLSIPVNLKPRSPRWSTTRSSPSSSVNAA